MDKKEYYKNCEKCGRPMTYAKPCECKYESSCLSEYCGTMPACIRNKKPDCLAKAVIPAITTDTVVGLTNMANCFAHVTNINTTFYIDDKHRPMITWAGPVEADIPQDIDSDEKFIAFIKSFNLRSQHLYARFYSNDDNKYVILDVYFDKNGTPYWGGEYYEMTEEPLI